MPFLWLNYLNLAFTYVSLVAYINFFLYVLREVNACRKWMGDCDSSAVGVGVIQGCVVLLLLFNSLMDWCIKEMKAKMGNVGARLRFIKRVDWSVATCHLWITLCSWQSERKIQRLMNEFYIVCMWEGNWRVNLEVSKMMVSKRKEIEIVDFRTLYGLSVPVAEQCEVVWENEGI